MLLDVRDVVGRVGRGGEEGGVAFSVFGDETDGFALVSSVLV